MCNYGTNDTILSYEDVSLSLSASATSKAIVIVSVRRVLLYMMFLDCCNLLGN